jgi:hypothetical protein
MSWAQLLEVRLLNDGSVIQEPQTDVVLMRHEIVGIEIIARFANRSNNENYIARLQRHYTSGLPGYISGWEDKTAILEPGEVTTLENTIYIHPTNPSSVGADSLTILSMMRHGSDPGDYLERYEFKVRVFVSDMDYTLPDIVGEPTFTRGLTNTVTWTPTEESNEQDVYCFDVEDRENLKKSVQQMYRINQVGPLEKVFENLTDGHTYGYMVKAVYSTPRGPVSLYTDITYSAQDNSPPETIIRPQALVTQDDHVQLSWNAVEDDVSGVTRYRIYRSIDTGIEEVVFDFPFEELGLLTWDDTAVEAGFTYYYRIRAVDAVGNEGDGERSNGISLGGPGGLITPPPDPGPIDTTAWAGNGFIKGVVDTVWFNLDGREKFVRFESVRDSASYFTNPPSLPMRHFDSGLIEPATLRSMGWVSPTDPYHVFYVFDYTDTGNGRIDQNFVNGHTYHRRVTRQYNAGSSIIPLNSKIPDCFPPEDIHNLRVETIIDDPDFQDPASGYTAWHINVSWEPAVDAVSGLKEYRAYRRIEGLDSAFMKIDLHENFKSISFIDTLAEAGRDTTRNPVVSYRIVSEDNIGNRRELNQTAWEVRERALGNPIVVLIDTTFTDTYPPNPSIEDTVFTNNDFALLRMIDFDVSDVDDYLISVNGVEVMPLQMYAPNLFTVQLPDEEVVRLKVRALYLGSRSSIWSKERIVVRTLDRPPRLLAVWNDSTYWKGNIQVKWHEPSLDTEGYEIWRWDEQEDSSLVGTLPVDGDTILWTDFYGFDELQEVPGDTLLNYQMYTYGVRKINMFGDTTAFSRLDSAYCNKPPTIDSSNTSIRSGNRVITIFWHRVFPTLAPGSYRTVVRVMRDSLTNPNYYIDEVVDNTQYTYDLDIELGHNYIFQIREIPFSHSDRPSGWSQPHTVNLASLELYAQPQPKGNIYISWDEDVLIDKLPVSYFDLYRKHDTSTLHYVIPDTITSFMDSTDLVHERMYEYTVHAVDSLGQIISTNTKEAMNDTGLVFIPDSVLFDYQYFNDDSITVSWQWKDIWGVPLDSTTRGADSLLIQTSVSQNFPGDSEYTVTTDWFAADTLNRSKRVKIPETVDAANRFLVFCRITAKDKWENPASIIWSTKGMVIYDPFPSDTVKILGIRSAKAYYRNPDSVVTRITWRGVADYSGTDDRVGNVAYYRIERDGYMQAPKSVVLDVLEKDDSFTYSSRDTVRNTEQQWRVVAVDGAGNETPSVWIEAPTLVPTPESPVPDSIKSCHWFPIQVDGISEIEYFVEIARDPLHFRYAYEISDDDMASRLLCQSDWIDTLGYQCMSGWGAIVMDTTWFRVKARIDTAWESGWSEPVSYPSRSGGGSKTAVMATGAIPAVFRVHQNMPNPFNAQTVIPYELPERGRVEIQIFNVLGSSIRVLTEDKKPAGYHSVVWDGRDEYGRSMASGIYIYCISVELTGNKTMRQWMKMTLIK